MPGPSRFQIRFAAEVVDHLRAIERKYHGLIAEAIEEQLPFTPGVETHNRKPLEQLAPFGATRELRLGPGNRFRVFYAIDDTTETVWILAIGVKERDRLIVGREEIEL